MYIVHTYIYINIYYMEFLRYMEGLNFMVL